MTVARDRERGFFYLEVLVGMAILAFSIVAMTPLFLLAAREEASAADLTTATTLATDKAESLAAQSFAALASGGDHTMKGAIRFERAWVVEPDVPHPGLKTVTVTVVPRRRVAFGASRVVTMRFYRAQ